MEVVVGGLAEAEFEIPAYSADGHKPGLGMSAVDLLSECQYGIGGEGVCREGEL